jgi:hypothetical protein
MPRSLIAMNDAFIDHAVDHRRGFFERRFSLGVFARFERQGCLSDGASQLRGEPVVPSTVHGRLSGSFFSRFGIRQARHSLKEPRSLPIDPAVVNSRSRGGLAACYSGATEKQET